MIAIHCNFCGAIIADRAKRMHLRAVVATDNETPCDPWGQVAVCQDCVTSEKPNVLYRIWNHGRTVDGPMS